MFSLGSIYSISPWEVNRCCNIESAETCTNTVNRSTIGERKTGCTAVKICFFRDLSTAIYLLNSACFCQNLLVPSACSWAVSIVGV